MNSETKDFLESCAIGILAAMVSAGVFLLIVAFIFAL